MKIYYLTLTLFVSLLIGCKTGTTTETNTNDDNGNVENPEEIWAAVQVKAQAFTIDPTQATKITGKQGTYLEFGPNILTYADGSEVKGKVTLSLKEYYQKSDMVTSGLTTTSDGKILKSAGMVYLEAKDSDGKTLQIKPDKDYKIGFPTKGKSDNNMQLFYGKREEGQMNWKSTKKKAAVLPKPIAKPTSEYIPTDTAYKEIIELYTFQAKKMRWINCDAFYDTPDDLVTKLTVVSDQSYTSANIIFYDDNIVLQGFIRGKGVRSFPRVLIGKTAVLTVVKKDKSGFYFYAQPIKVDKALEIKVNLQKTNPVAAKKKIEALLNPSKNR